MSKSNDGGPAFPYVAEGGQNNGCSPELEHGMSLRDWFAGQAMAAIIGKIPFEEFPEDFSPYKKTAIGAYDYADAMLAAREASEPGE